MERNAFRQQQICVARDQSGCPLHGGSASRSHCQRFQQIWGPVGGFGQSAAYHASKGAVTAITRNAAIRYAGDNIRINAVSPGFISVVREEKTIQEAGSDMADGIISRTPMGRWGQAAEVASVIKFLVSSDVSYVTGVDLFVDGGWMAV